MPYGKRLGSESLSYRRRMKTFFLMDGMRWVSAGGKIDYLRNPRYMQDFETAGIMSQIKI